MAYIQPDSSPFLRVRKTTKGKGRNFRTAKEGAGMTSAGVRRYKKQNPGSKLQTAVTGKVKAGSKAASLMAIFFSYFPALVLPSFIALRA